MRDTYAAWRVKVDKEVQRLVGVSIDDLPDQPDHDWFEEGWEPIKAAKKAIKSAKDEL